MHHNLEILDFNNSKGMNKRTLIPDIMNSYKCGKIYEIQFKIFFLIQCFFWIPSLAFSIEKVNDVFLISIPEDLDTFAAMVNNGDSAIQAVLVNDIYYINRSSNIGNYYSKKAFCGTFDGAGHTLYFDISLMGHEISLCQYLTHGGIIKNLHMKGKILTCGYSSASLVGHMEDGIISNCLVEMDIDSDRDEDLCYGGLVGTTYGKSVIQNCMYQGKITAKKGYNVAGLVGKVCAPGAVIKDCISIFDFKVSPSDKSSNAVLNTDSLEWVTMENVYYRGMCPWKHPGIKKIPDGENINKYVYNVYGNLALQLEKKILNITSEQEQEKSRNERKLHETKNDFQELLNLEREKEGRLNSIIYVSCFLVVLFIVLLTIYYQQDKMHKREIENLHNSLYQQEQIWKNQVEVLKKALEPEPTPEEEQAKNAMEALYRKLLQIMQEKELYKNPDLNETILARELCTNNNRISKCINKISGKNIKDWLATYRIQHASKLIREMESEKSLDLNKVIAQSGYSSRSTFYRQFKKVTGISPNQIKSQDSPKNN
jgi:AraC-like DNA-binding protein